MYPLFTSKKAGRSTIKYNYSDSLIAYYTRWDVIHSVPTSYFCYPYNMWLLSFIPRFNFLFKLCYVRFLPVYLKYSYTIRSVIILKTGYCVLLMVHILIVKMHLLLSRISSIQANKCPFICVTTVVVIGRLCCSRCWLIMPCKFAWSLMISRLY